MTYLFSCLTRKVLMIKNISHSKNKKPTTGNVKKNSLHLNCKDRNCAHIRILKERKSICPMANSKWVIHMSSFKNSLRNLPNGRASRFLKFDYFIDSFRFATHWAMFWEQNKSAPFQNLTKIWPFTNKF